MDLPDVDKEGLRRINSDPARLAASLAPAPPLDYADATNFRRQYHYSATTPKVSAPVRATILEMLATIYDPFVSATLSLDNASFEEMDLAERIQLLLQTPRVPERERLVSAESTKETTLTHAFLSLLKSFVGTGILFLPQGFQRGGVVFAPALLAAVAVVTVFAMFRLLACRERLGGSYSHIGEVVLGPAGHRLVQCSLVLLQFGFCCSYIIFVAQNLQDVLAYYGTAASLTSLVLLQMLVYIPLSWIRYMRYFTLSNLVADVFVLYAIVYILYVNGSALAAHGVAEPLAAFNPQDYAVFMGTAVFVFEGVGLIIPIQAALAPALQPRFKWLLAQTVAGLVVFFSLFATVNYAAIGNAVEPMILSSLPRVPQTMWVQAGYALAQVLAYPLFLFPALQIVEDVLGFPRRSSGLKLQKNLIRGTMVGVTVLIAYAGQARLDLFVSLVGAFCCVPLGFIYPSLFYLKLAPDRGWLSKALDYGVIAIGLFVFVFVTWTNIAAWSSPM
ncbi:vacuolar amino acid transporter [Achlya hypogyna]|uniref:Vacuolar amino acid transporter n=1 Tax=Achlya hypogyna TaxID=1202772 RepID=A0A1V9YQV7_ACHHY|nr:vacuolar amino acid transporter [Achlya hypogyna]